MRSTNATDSLFSFPVPEKSLVLTQTKLNEHKAVNITCKAEGVFPEPELFIHSKER
jgi:hypothetical protein